MLYKLQTPHEVINYSSANEVVNDIVRDGQLIRAIEVYKLLYVARKINHLQRMNHSKPRRIKLWMI